VQSPALPEAVPLVPIPAQGNTAETVLAVGQKHAFPISTASPIERRGPTRHSLEVPGSAESSPVVDRPTNGTPTSASATDSPIDGTGVSNRDSLGRTTPVATRFPRKAAPGLAQQALTNRSSLDGMPLSDGSGTPVEKRGVELVDKPMDD